MGTLLLGSPWLGASTWSQLPSYEPPSCTTYLLTNSVQGTSPLCAPLFLICKMGVTVLPHGVLARVREVLLDSVEQGLTHSKCGLLSRWLLAVTCERFDGPGWEGS